jgi:hypothetical protein
MKIKILYKLLTSYYKYYFNFIILKNNINNILNVNKVKIQKSPH